MQGVVTLGKLNTYLTSVSKRNKVIYEEECTYTSMRAKRNPGKIVTSDLKFILGIKFIPSKIYSNVQFFTTVAVQGR